MARHVLAHETGRGSKPGRAQTSDDVMVRNDTEDRKVLKDDDLPDLRTLLRGLRDELSEVRDDIRELRTERDPESLLTREEAAERLRISTRTLDDMAAEGEIQPIRVRGRVLYHPDALDAYIRHASREGGQR